MRKNSVGRPHRQRPKHQSAGNGWRMLPLGASSPGANWALTGTEGRPLPREEPAKPCRVRLRAPLTRFTQVAGRGFSPSPGGVGQSEQTPDPTSWVRQVWDSGSGCAVDQALGKCDPWVAVLQRGQSSAGSMKWLPQRHRGVTVASALEELIPPRPDLSTLSAPLRATSQNGPKFQMVSSSCRDVQASTGYRSGARNPWRGEFF